MMKTWVTEPLTLLVAAFVCLGIGIAWFIWYRRHSRQGGLFGSRGGAFFMLAVIFGGCAIASAYYGSRSVAELRRHIPIYPKAKYESSIGYRNKVLWRFYTKDSPEAVLAYYQQISVPGLSPPEQPEADKLIVTTPNRKATIRVTQEGTTTTILYELDARR